MYKHINYKDVMTDIAELNGKRNKLTHSCWSNKRNKSDDEYERMVLEYTAENKKKLIELDKRKSRIAQFYLENKHRIGDYDDVRAKRVKEYKEELEKQLKKRKEMEVVYKKLTTSRRQLKANKNYKKLKNVDKDYYKTQDTINKIDEKIDSITDTLMSSKRIISNDRQDENLRKFVDTHLSTH